MRDDEFMLGSCSDHARIVPALELTLQLFSANFSLILECNFAWQAQYSTINDAHHFFVAGAVFGDLGVSLFVTGAVFGDLGMSFFVAGAASGDLGVSLFGAGVVFGEIWVDSRSAKRCNFQYKMCLRSAKSNLGERAGAR